MGSHPHPLIYIHKTSSRIYDCTDLAMDTIYPCLARVTSGKDLMPQQSESKMGCYGLGKSWAWYAFYGVWPEGFITYTSIMIYVGRIWVGAFGLGWRGVIDGRVPPERLSLEFSGTTQWLPLVERCMGGGGVINAIRFLRWIAAWRARATRAFFEVLLAAILLNGAVAKEQKSVGEIGERLWAVKWNVEG